MQSFRSCALWALLLSPAALLAQTTVSGVLSVGGGTVLQDGNRAAFQEAAQQKKGEFGGLEAFNLLREGKDDVLKFEARALPGLDDYRLFGRYEKTEKYYVEAGFEQFRVWSDGSGGYFRPTNTSFSIFNEDLHLDRSKLWVEAGVTLENATTIRLRYQRNTREGTKSTTIWGDSNAVGKYGTRNIVPGFYDLDETTDLVTFDVANESQETQKWAVGARYSKTDLDDKRYNRRRPLEPSADRIITSKDTTSNDLFATHGYYLRQVTEKLTLSGGAMISKLDTNISGSRIYGQSYDPVFDPAYLRRQQRDEGFYDLSGSADIKQTVLNLNAVYVPRKNWSIRPSLRYENLHQEGMSEFVETNIGAGPKFAAILEDLEGESQRKWDEFTEAIDVRYTGLPNWTFSGAAEWLQGSGNLEEKERDEAGVVSIDRDTDTERNTQKYSLNANWYAKPGLTFAAQYYYKIRNNDYKSVRDNTPATGGDRFPAYITDQDFKTHDLNFRVSWRPMSQLSLVTRYDYQQSKTDSAVVALAHIESGRFTSHILSQSVTWSPTARLFVTGSVNLTYDQIKTPAYEFVKYGDNNYINATLGAGYVVSQKDDVFVDYSLYRSSNFIDNSYITLPFGAEQKQQAGYITWKRRQSETLIYTVKYGYITNDDVTWAGLNDFNAHVIYAKVQYLF